jgi:hypothetical protein
MPNLLKCLNFNERKVVIALQFFQLIEQWGPVIPFKKNLFYMILTVLIWYFGFQRDKSF